MLPQVIRLQLLQEQHLNSMNHWAREGFPSPAPRQPQKRLGSGVQAPRAAPRASHPPEAGLASAALVQTGSPSVCPSASSPSTSSLRLTQLLPLCSAPSTFHLAHHSQSRGAGCSPSLFLRQRLGLQPRPWPPGGQGGRRGPSSCLGASGRATAAPRFL